MGTFKRTTHRLSQLAQYTELESQPRWCRLRANGRWMAQPRRPQRVSVRNRLTRAWAFGLEAASETCERPSSPRGHIGKLNCLRPCTMSRRVFTAAQAAPMASRLPAQVDLAANAAARSSCHNVHDGRVTAGAWTPRAASTRPLSASYADPLTRPVMSVTFVELLQYTEDLRRTRHPGSIDKTRSRGQRKWVAARCGRADW